MGNSVGDIIVCFSTCELDTLDMSGDEHGVIYTAPRSLMLMSADSSDTFTINQFPDSLIVDAGDVPIEIRSPVEMGASSLKFFDSAQTDTTSLFQVADTFNIATNDTSIIVKIGSGSVFISDRAIWFDGNYIDHDVYGFALGLNDTVTGNYASAWGWNTNSTGSYSTTWGGFTTASNYAATAWGDNTTASGSRSTSWGDGARASGLVATAWGNSATASGDYSTAWTGASANGAYSTAWGDFAITNGRNSTCSGYYIFADSTADYSFFIGLNDTLTDDSTFCSSYPYNEFRGQVKIGELGIGIKKIAVDDSIMIFITEDDDTFKANPY